MTTTSTLTVTQLTAAIKNQLETRFPLVAVQGEISNCKLHSAGHLYFDLKDAESKIPAVMFRPQVLGLKRPPKEGDQVYVKGSLTVYPPHGRYQLLIRELDYAGIGELLVKLEELKKKLSEKGWFDPSRKRKLPPFPKRIGVVTSPTGAVIRDIIHVLSRRFSGFQLLLNPVRVQGAGAGAEIAQAIEQFNRYQLADILIVGRGGGSLEDLWAFNEEIVAEAIFRSHIPIVSAVGHETDVTIADFVADVRAPTPSAAAEIVLSEKIQHLQFLKKMQQNTSYALQHLLRGYRERLQGWKRHPTLASPYVLLGVPLQKLDEVKEKLENRIRHLLLHQRVLLQAKQKEANALKPTTQLSHFRNKLTQFSSRLDQSYRARMQFQKQQIRLVSQQFVALDPKNVLKRGYSILFDQKTGSIIVSSQEMAPGKEVRALLSDGEASLKVSPLS